MLTKYVPIFAIWMRQMKVFKDQQQKNKPPYADFIQCKPGKMTSCELSGMMRAQRSDS